MDIRKGIIMKDKFCAILIRMFVDEDFREHINKEFHCFYSVIFDLYEDLDCDYNELPDAIIESAKPYIKLIYQELEDWY